MEWIWKVDLEVVLEVDLEVDLLDLLDVVIFASVGSVAGFIRTFLAVAFILEPIQVFAAPENGGLFGVRQGTL